MLFTTETHFMISCDLNFRPHHLYVSAVVAPGRKLDAPESDRTLERDLDGRLFHAVLAVKAGSSWDGTATEVPLNCGRR